MAKVKSVYTCNECGANSPKWVGQCPSCTAWNSLYETTVVPITHARAGRQYGAPAAVHNLAEVTPEITPVNVSPTWGSMRRVR